MAAPPDSGTASRAPLIEDSCRAPQICRRKRWPGRLAQRASLCRLIPPETAEAKITTGSWSGSRDIQVVAPRVSQIVTAWRGVRRPAACDLESRAAPIRSSSSLAQAVTSATFPANLDRLRSPMVALLLMA